MNHLGDTNKMVDDKTIIEWNADVGTRFLTIYPDGSFHINQNTPPLYALGELAKAFIKQQDRIKRLEEQLMESKNKYAVLVADVVLRDDKIERIAQLEEALEGTVKWIVDLADSGDAGFWNPEEQSVIIAARAALQAKEAKL
jgi:hypothetical protein